MRRYLQIWTILCACLLILPLASVVRAQGDTCGDCGGIYENGFCACGYQPAEISFDGCYEIGNAGQLYWFADLIRSGQSEAEACLIADIVVNQNLLARLEPDGSGNIQPDADIRSWLPIISEGTAWCGLLDGAGYCISGLYCYDPDGDYVGLFGYLTDESALIRNVTIVDSYFYGREMVGAILGCGSAQIVGCSSNSRVVGTSYVGGLVGCAQGEILDCTHTGQVSARELAGGIAGSVEDTLENRGLENCRNEGSVTGSVRNIGGIAGYNRNIIYGCVNTGTVQAPENVGGLAGCNYNALISCCSNSGSVSGSGICIGGIAGESYAVDGSSTVHGCLNQGSVQGHDCVGGIVGHSHSNFLSGQAKIADCADIGTVTGDTAYVGGIAGLVSTHNEGRNEISSCFTLTDTLLTGPNGCMITQCYYLSPGPGSGAGEPKNTLEFASGHVAYLLGASYGQNLDNGGTNPGYPTHGGPAVYPLQVYSCTGIPLQGRYSNYPDRTVTSHNYSRGVCLDCDTADPEYHPVRLAGTNRFETALLVADEMKARLGKEKFDTVILASGSNFADALSGSYLAAAKEAPILLCWNGDAQYQYLNQQVTAYIRENLAENGTVYILGGTAAVPESMETGMGDVQIRRLAGADRFETNLLILEEAGVRDGDEILVCTGTNFADSLSASATGKPILLVWSELGNLYGRQSEYLTTLSSCRFTVIGGEKAVGTDLERAVAGYGITDRLAGRDRFATSVLVAREYFDSPGEAVLAYAWNYPDGLCGGALAYIMDAPLLLTMTGYEAEANAYSEDLDITDGVVLGGEGLISEESVRHILTAD